MSPCHTCTHTHTHTRHANLGTHIFRQLCINCHCLTHLCTTQWAPIPLIENSDHPAPPSKSAPLHSLSSWFPKPTFYSRPAKLFPAWIMVCSCSRTIREVFFCFPTPFHASLSFSFHSPHIILLLQAAFPDELTLNLPWSVALVDLCSGECHQVTLIVRCQGERCKLPKGRAT